MRPDRPTLAGVLTRCEVDMGAIMVELHDAGRLAEAQECREQLAAVLVERAIVSQQELNVAKKG